MFRQTFFMTVMLFASLSAALSQEVAKRLPVPADSAQCEAMKLVKEIYGDEYKNAKTVAQRTALAEKLLQKASESKSDPAGYFVLLKLARDIAAQAGEADLALRAVEDTASAYQVDGYAMKVETLLKAGKAACLSKQYPAIVERAKVLLDEAVGKDDFDSATQLAETALTAAKSSKDLSLVKQTVNRNKEVEEIGKAYVEAKDSLAILDKKPADPEANLAVGKYQCFFKGNWDKGISKLALGNDDALKSLAVKELERTSDPNVQAALGDGWWGLAEKEDGTAKKQLQGRAAYWYRQALPELGGLVKDKVEKRLHEVGLGPVLAETAKTAAQPPHEELRNKKVAIWVLRQGGKLTVQLAGSEASEVLDATTTLPKEPFRVLEIDLANAKQVSDSGLENLAGLKSLTVLNLFGTPVTDAGLAHLRGLGNLRELNLAATKVSGSGLVNLRGHRNLEKLYFGGCPLTDAGLMQLRGIDNLTFLGLHYTKVTDAGVPYLAGLKNLRQIKLSGTKVSDAAVRRVLPNCEIER